MRLDKYINDITGEGRSLIKKKIKAGLVKVNHEVVKNPDTQIDESKSQVTYDGKALFYARFYYYILHKPAGVISATKDKQHKTVIDLLGEDILPHIKKDLFPVGRLDIDTEGLVLLTNDGELAHELLSPTKHVDKTYFCRTSQFISDEQIKALEVGVDIGEKKLTKPAKVSKINENEILLTITEGKFHQIKRMLHAVGNEIIYLKRISMGPISLPNDLEVGCYCELKSEEIQALKEYIGK